MKIKKPWQQWKSETNTAYHRFMIYLKMGPDRSLKKTRQKLGKSSGYIRQLHTWSSKYDWVDRCKAYDEHIQLKSLCKREQIIDKVHGKLLDKLEKAVDEYLEISMMENVSFGGKRSINNVPTKLKALMDLLNRLGVDFSVNDELKKRAEKPKYQQVNNYFKNLKN